MSESIICDRSFELASRLLKLADRIWDRSPSARHVASQLMRCGTSIGANAEEAQEGQSRADFIAKMNISRTWELSEAHQLLAMIRSAVLTAQSRLKKPPKGRG